LSTANRSALEDDYKLLNKIYKELLKSNDSANITLMGDSAGGNMALVMAQQLKLAKLPKPCKIILISPPVDFGTNSIIAKQLADHDPVLP
jgi:acetyl esterase/lipase